MIKIYKIIKILTILCIVGVVIGIFSYQKVINTPLKEKAGTKEFVVASGDSVKDISAKLSANELIGSRFFFEFYIDRQDKEHNMQAGVYALSPSMNIKEIVKILTKGQNINNERAIKIIEGWNNRDIASYFAKEGLFKKERFLQEVKKVDKYANNFKFLQEIPKSYDMEGYLFPDTYKIYKKADLEDVVYKMLNNFDKKITPQMRADIESKNKSLYEIMIMASLIEKEVRKREDMEVVSGIFWNRLKNGQALQSCATLAYVLGENKPVYSTKDTKIDSPYNTYQNPGLPPAPIANPGLQAIKAAINPQETNYNYFLTATKTEKTIFSRTLREHNINKEKYIK